MDFRIIGYTNELKESWKMRNLQQKIDWNSDSP